MRTLYFFSLILLLPATVWAQVGIGGQPNASAVLDLQTPNHDKAFYPPRLSSAQRLAIANPQVGALVYDLDKNTLYLYDGQNWLPLLTTSPGLLPPTNRTASDGAATDRFGFSVAISGDYAIVGAQQKAIGSNGGQGAAYVFVRSGSSWSQQTRLVASDGTYNDAFGTSVAISGDYAFVGARYKIIGSNQNQGAAYVFVRSGSSWSQQTRLVASDGTYNDAFGTSVAISGDYAIVGAESKTFSNQFQGAAYVFMRSGSSWSQQTRLVASDGATFDLFGHTVAISGDYAIVGAPNKAIGSNGQQGAAYVFMRSGSSWPQQQRLVASDGTVNDGFGTSVAISGDYAIVGAQYKTIGSNTDQGAAYVFMRSGSSWPQQQRVTDNGPAGTYNGASVGLSNGTYLIGGYGYQNSQGKVSFGTVN